jgi:hypothetical protein
MPVAHAVQRSSLHSNAESRNYDNILPIHDGNDAVLHDDNGVTGITGWIMANFRWRDAFPTYAVVSVICCWLRFGCFVVEGGRFS